MLGAASMTSYNVIQQAFAASKHQFCYTADHSGTCAATNGDCKKLQKSDPAALSGCSKRPGHVFV
jgi:hypothetical protein